MPVLTEEQLRALLRAVDHDREFFGLRDAAIIRLFVDTGARLAEVSELLIAGTKMDAQAVTFLGKRRLGAINPIGTRPSARSTAYMRVRSRAPRCLQPRLWLGRSGPMTAYGIAEAVKRRAREAGIGGIRVHQLRHSAAHYLRLAGPDDAAVLRLMGWKDRSMLHRYGKSEGNAEAMIVTQC